MTAPQIITATAYSKNRRLAVGQNSYTRSHPYQKKLAVKAGEPNKLFLHAEVQVLLKCLKLRQQVQLLQIERYGVNGNMLLAKPCIICQLAIGEAGVRQVRYTSADGWVTEDVNCW